MRSSLLYGKKFLPIGVDSVTVKLKIVLHVFTPEALGYSLTDCRQREVETSFLAGPAFGFWTYFVFPE